MAASTDLKKIVALLQKGTTEESIAAAVVLGALAPKEKSAVDALTTCLGTRDNLPLALASARALGRIGNAAALKALLPLLRAEGDLRDTGALAIADCGRAALPAVKKELATADFHTKRVLYAILARLHSAESIHLLLDGFFDPNFEMVKAVSRELRSQIPALTPVERKAAGAATLIFLKSKPVQASRSAVNSCLIYLGHLGTVEAVPELLRRTGPDEPRAMRRHALHALRGVLQGGKAPVKVVETLFPYLDDPNFEDVVEPTLAVLERAELPAAYEKELERLIGGRTPQVRAFAVRKLAESPGKRAAELLVGLVDGPDEALRRSAVSALKTSPRAASLVLPKLLTEKNADRAWELVHLVKAHAPKLSAPELKSLGVAAVKALDAGDRRSEPLLHLFRHADAKGYYKTFFDRAMKAKTARRYADGERDLRLISRAEEFDVEARFQLGLLTLLGAGKDPAPASPKVKLALEAFRGLAEDPAFPFAAHLKKEARVLGPEGIYLIGFGLVEGAGRTKALGADLLKSVVKKGPKTKVGRAAKAKLDTEGLA
jgi:HEAT repeat protein